MGSRAQVQSLWRTGLVAPQHVGSSRTRARTRVPCISRRILNHCATREAPSTQFLKTNNPVFVELGRGVTRWFSEGTCKLGQGHQSLQVITISKKIQFYGPGAKVGKGLDRAQLKTEQLPVQKASTSDHSYMYSRISVSGPKICHPFARDYSYRSRRQRRTPARRAPGRTAPWPGRRARSSRRSHT